jgi:HSP20 family molecular chaperone IbpA
MLRAHANAHVNANAHANAHASHVNRNSGEWVEYPSYYQLKMPCVGFKRENIKVTVDSSTQLVSIRGIQILEVKDAGFVSQQMREFSHSMALPSNVIIETLQAQFRGNTLVLTVAKNKQSGSDRVRRIPVR